MTDDALTDTSPVTGWPFWAPSDLAAVERALDLAGVRRGDRVADLGCGDGQVLVAAARRGAKVIGVECDDELAQQAREALAANGLDGEVLVGDLLDLDLAADVYFTYLAPATLQRLVGRLARHEGARLVTVDFAVPGLVSDEVVELTHLYHLPGRPRRRQARPGWGSAGGLVISPPDCQSLTVLDLHHPGGPVEVVVSDELVDLVTVVTGTDDAAVRQHVAVDLRWEPEAAGTWASGTLTVEGVGPFSLTVIFSEDGEEGLWELTEEGVENLLGRLADPPAPTSGTELVEAAGG